jgi:hypothetical protein
MAVLGNDDGSGRDPSHPVLSPTLAATATANVSGSSFTINIMSLKAKHGAKATAGLKMVPDAPAAAGAQELTQNSIQANTASGKKKSGPTKHGRGGKGGGKKGGGKGGARGGGKGGTKGTLKAVPDGK